MYNLEIRDYHTYFVGGNNTVVLVHNDYMTEKADGKLVSPLDKLPKNVYHVKEGDVGIFHVERNDSWFATIRYSLNDPEDQGIARQMADRLAAGGNVAAVSKAVRKGIQGTEIALRILNEPIDFAASTGEFIEKPGVVTAMGMLPGVPGGMGAAKRALGEVGGRAIKALDRFEIIAKADDALIPLAKAFPDAQVGFRGSLARGTKGPHKGGIPFDPTNFDVDAFIVSDSLAAAIPKDKKGFRNLGRQPEHQEMIKSISKTLQSIPGHRDQGVKIRVFSREEFAKLSPDEVHLLQVP